MSSDAALARYTGDDSPEHDERRVEAFGIGSTMKAQGLPSQFIARAVDLSEEFEGIFDLMRLWRDESDTGEREEIISDIQDLIDDCCQGSKAQAAYIRFDDLDGIAADVRKFKDSLRALVDERGGIGKLAELTHMPQPSISRFFNSASMPRRVTLNKFARALNLSQVQIATPWAV
jgi:DNA-binding phage protein